MSSTFKKVAAVAAAATLVISGASAANAQPAGADGTVQGQIDLGSLGANLGSSAQVDADGNPVETPSSLGNLGTGSDNGTATPPEDGAADTGSMSGLGDTGSLKAYGQSPDSGSLLQPVDFFGTGSLDTQNSSLGEPTSGSLSGLNTAINGSVGFSNPAPGTGSVDTSGSILGEPTTGSLAGLWAPVAGSLGINEGITTVLGSGSAEILIPVVLVGGSIAAGIALAPMIQQAIAGANITLPGMPVIALPALPGLPVLPGSSMPVPPAAPTTTTPAPAPGPDVDNGRG